MDLSNVQDFFGGRHYCYRGFHFVGQLMAVTTEEASLTFTSPRRLLKVGPKCAVKAGDVIRVTTGKRYLVGDHGPSELFGGLLYYSYRLFEVTHASASLARKVTSPKNAITGIVTAGHSHVANIPVAIEYIKSQVDEMKIQADLVRIVSSTPILVGDTINEYIVTNVETQLGLFFAIARKI